MIVDNPTFAERCGLVVGGWLAPLTGAVSAKRQARMFHPDGAMFRAEIRIDAAAQDLVAAAVRLGESALARFSSALWREGHEWPDVLGVALRFGGEASPQDLLFATIRFPWTMPFAPFATRFSTFAWNHYNAVSPFSLDGVGAVKLRLRSPRLGNHGSDSREQHLVNLSSEGRAVFVLECRRLAKSALARRWEPLATVKLVEPSDVDGQSMRFSPFNDSAGVHPTGFVHALRLAAYGASQAARP